MALKNRKLVFSTVIIMAVILGTVIFYWPLLKPKKPMPLQNNPYRLFDMMLIAGYVDEGVLPENINLTNKQFTKLAINAFEDEFQDRFPGVEVEILPYGEPYTFNTNPLAIVWEVHLRKLSDGEYGISGVPYRPYGIEQEISYRVWKEGYNFLNDQYFELLAEPSEDFKKRAMRAPDLGDSDAWGNARFSFKSNKESPEGFYNKIYKAIRKTDKIDEVFSLMEPAKDIPVAKKLSPKFQKIYGPYIVME